MKWLYILSVLLAALLTIAFSLGFHRRPKTIRNFEEEEYGREQFYINPVAVSDGLAIYRVGEGHPVLLFPYPHSHTTVPTAQGELAAALVDLGRRVITFDVPGTYRSTREPVGDMTEMLDSAEEALNNLGIEGPVDVVGHSMSGLAALAFAVE